jgi:hypothetical protein
LISSTIIYEVDYDEYGGWLVNSLFGQLLYLILLLLMGARERTAFGNQLEGSWLKRVFFVGKM